MVIIFWEQSTGKLKMFRIHKFPDNSMTITFLFHVSYFFVPQPNNETLTYKILKTNNDEIKQGFVTIHHKY